MAAASPPGLAPAGWVVDASVTMPWFSKDEATPLTERTLDALGEQVFWALSLWVLECINVLRSAQRRRRRLEASRPAAIAGELAALPVRLDVEVSNFRALDRLAATHGLSADDAAYLELALRRSLVWVNLEDRLLAAVKALGHSTLSGMAGVGRRALVSHGA